ncbi:MAG: DUF4440 domain-containing protein [Gemmatimonadota bacterium]|nr:DUF4440 domain-containing protein [Gemmatimonadota bacterium]
MRFIDSALLGTALVLTACRSAAPPADTRAEEAAIRTLDEQWNHAANRKDLEATLALYAADGATMWPDAPTSHGPQAIRAAWTEMFKTPGVSLQFLPDKIGIASAGDLATEEGRVVVATDTPRGRSADTAKYLVIWKKADGKLRVAYDTYNSNKPSVPVAPSKDD